MAIHPQAKLVNTTTIETSTGLRSINLYHGDICAAEDELLVISSHAGHDNKLTGMVVESLSSRFFVDFSHLAAQYRLEDIPSVGTFRVKTNPQNRLHPAKEILVVRIPGYKAIQNSSIDPMAIYSEAVWTLFGTLAAWEQKGGFFNSMAMPLLAGKRGYPELSIMHVILAQATNWLKSSRRMEAINLYLMTDDQVKTWDSAMNQVLGRRSIDSAKNEVVRALRDEILVLLAETKKFQKTELAATVKPIRESLVAKDIFLQQVAAFGRTLVEKIVFSILHERGLEIKPVLAQNIQSLSYLQVVAPWIVNHMHALRVFGNETLHAKGQVSYKPESLQEDDLVAILTSLRSVIQFYAAW